MMGPRWAGRVLGGGSCRCWMITAGSGARAQGGCGCECAHAYAHAHACACACAHAPVRILQPLSFLKLKYVMTDMPHVQVRALARALRGRLGNGAHADALHGRACMHPMLLQTQGRMQLMGLCLRSCVS